MLEPLPHLRHNPCISPRELAMPRPPLAALGRRLPVAVRFMLQHGAIGFGIAAVFVALLMATDMAGLGTLLRGADSAPLPALLLWFFCGLTFGSVQIGAAVMLMDTDDQPPAGGTRAPILVPIPVRARRRR